MTQPSGELVKDWTEFGHHFQIEKLLTPVLRGAGMRTHRLWDNSRPAVGFQWHYDLDGAVRAADYMLQCSYSKRVAWLEMRVAEVEHQLRQKELEIARLKIAPMVCGLPENSNDVLPCKHGCPVDGVCKAIYNSKAEARKASS